MRFLLHANTLRQLLFWSALWLFSPLMLGGSDWYLKHLPRVVMLTSTASVVLLLNLSVLLPRFYFTKRYFLFALSGWSVVFIGGKLIVTAMLYWVGEDTMDKIGPPFNENQSIDFWAMKASVPLIMTLIGSTLYETSVFATKKENEAVLLRAEKLETEIKFLKSQINPHFLFNALNNIYALTLLQSNAAAENLLKLSAMLRYMLYDCNAPMTTLQKEIEYIRNFIDLFRLKDSGGIDIRLDVDESRPNMPVAPLIFIPFIENAFKHSDIEKIGTGWVSIALTFKDDLLVFKVKNPLPATPKSKDAAGGIGLENVRRQLQLVYPNSHTLDIKPSETEFEVILTLKSTPA